MGIFTAEAFQRCAACLRTIYAVCSFRDIKKKNTTQNNRLNVQHCCSSAFAFMNESAVCVHTGFPAARSARSAEKETFEAILCSDGGNGKAGLLLRM